MYLSATSFASGASLYSPSKDTVNVLSLLLYSLAIAVASPLSIPPLKKQPTSRSDDSILLFTAACKNASVLCKASSKESLFVLYKNHAYSTSVFVVNCKLLQSTIENFLLLIQLHFYKE